jgi:formamidopyrimidine-DNA glycosylase
VIEAFKNIDIKGFTRDMPELPEVETVRRGLTNLVAGRTIQSTEVRWEKTVGGLTAAEFNDALRNQKIIKIDRRGKYLLFRFTNDITIV